MFDSVPGKRPVGRPRVYVPSQLIRHLKTQGLSLRQIAAITGYSYGSIRRNVQNHATFDPVYIEHYIRR